MGAAWNSRTNLRAVQTITQHVVEICFQMEGWRRLLRHVARLEGERQPADHPRLPRLGSLHLVRVEEAVRGSVVDHSGDSIGPLPLESVRQVISDSGRIP